MIGKSIQPEVQSLIRARAFVTLREVFDDLPVPDVAPKTVLSSSASFRSTGRQRHLPISGLTHRNP
jgi:hypothetical protein